MVRSGRAVVAAAMWEEEIATHSNYGPTLTHQTLYSRGAQAVHSAQCAMMCAAVLARVHGMERPGPARHVAGEGRAAAVLAVAVSGL
jgi:hypothetical protein